MQTETLLKQGFSSQQSSTAIGIQVGLAFDGLLSVSAGFGSSFETTSTSFTSQQISSTETRGGDPSSSPFKNWTVWADSLNEVTSPISRTVAPISNLIRWTYPEIAKSIDDALVLLPQYGKKLVCNAKTAELDGAEGILQNVKSSLRCAEHLQSPYNASEPRSPGFPQRVCVVEQQPMCQLSNGNKCNQALLRTGMIGWGFSPPGVTTIPTLCTSVGSYCAPNAETGMCSICMATTTTKQNCKNTKAFAPSYVVQTAMDTCLGVPTCEAYIYNNN